MKRAAAIIALSLAMVAAAPNPGRVPTNLEPWESISGPCMEDQTGFLTDEMRALMLRWYEESGEYPLVELKSEGFEVVYCWADPALLDGPKGGYSE